MNKTLLTGLLCCSLSIQSFADQPLEGFTYGSVNAPTGKEWESPENLAQGVEFIACQMSMDMMGIRREELLDEVTIGGVVSALRKIEYGEI